LEIFPFVFPSTTQNLACTTTAFIIALRDRMQKFLEGNNAVNAF